MSDCLNCGSRRLREHTGTYCQVCGEPRPPDGRIYCGFCCDLRHPDEDNEAVCGTCRRYFEEQKGDTNDGPGSDV